MALPVDYDGCLITFEATLVERRAADDRGMFMLATGKTGAVAYAEPRVFRALADVKEGSLLSVTGIAESVPEVGSASSSLQRVDRVAILLRSADDIRVIRVPSWWTPRRVAIVLASAVAVLAGGALAAAGWIILLRSQVARQFAVIQDKLHAEAVAEERRRIAREFHDSLDQGLAGLSLRLDAAARQTSDTEARGVLLQQQRLLASLQNEARDFLWDLRYPTHVDGLLADSIQAQLLYMQSLTPLPLELENHGPPLALPQMEHYQLLRIVREAVNNCIRHARARRITVRLDGVMPDGTAGFVQIEAQDDGVGFDVAAREAADGHFGLRGMQERARRIGATLHIDSSPGRGTRVVVRLPLSHHQPLPHDSPRKPRAPGA
jgi:signal transduction histidine kinase